eukprot:GHVU01083526.1.p2 GENE.GHVU01083526.1~~GHVU01083526.1.p2  ORF type:complete len:163 (+),score=3.76 GHVU01083526.1:893-1381(+)
MTRLRRYLLLPVQRNPRRVRRYRNPLERHTDLELYATYRFDREGLTYLEELLHDALTSDEVRDGRGQPVPHLTSILATLQYLAGHERQSSLGLDLGVCQATVSRAVHAVTTALAAMAQRFIKFPTSAADIRGASEAFLGYCGIDGVIGAVDCTLTCRFASPL